MKIVHICLVGGYTEGLHYQENVIIKYQALDGHDVSLITTDHCYTEGVWGLCQTESNYINPHGVHIIRLPFALPFPYNVNRQLGIFKGFYNVLEKLDPEIIFVHNIQFQDIRKVAAYKKRHPQVAVYVDNHSDLINSARNWFSRNTLYRFWWKPCAKAIEPYTKKFWGVMPSRVDFLHNIFGISPDKTDMLLMGADDESVVRVENPAIQRTTREKFGILQEDFLIVTGGKIDVTKPHTLLLMKAVREIARDNLKLLVFGSVAEELQNDFFSLCDGNKVQYIGWAQSDQAYEYFASADLVAFPGKHSVYWEQVTAQGVPMICRYWDGTTHIDIGGNVEFLTQDSVEEISKKLLQILDKPGKYDEMKKAAQSDLRHEFSYKIIARKSVGLME